MATLAVWEKRLTPFFNKTIRIIGEIPLSEADLDEILDLVQDEILKTSLPKTTRRLVKLNPHTFLTMLAHFAMYNDSQGYWTNLADRLGVESLHTNVKWHQWALALIQGYGLFHFSSKDMDNFYVATVRFHGGIPTYSLPDFFNQMVIPAVTRPELREHPPIELLPRLVENVYFVDKPVLDFLANAGEMGATWFEECCLLARHANQNHREVLPKEDVPDLPLYIYQFFEKYNEGLDDSRYQWRRPFLQVAPYSDDSAVILNLPQQIVPMEFYTRGLTWRITWPDLPESILQPCVMKKLRQDTLTGEDFYPIPPTARNITVSIHSPEVGQMPGEEHRRWTLPLLPFSTQPPLIAFREDKRHIANPQTLPAKPQYLLTPRDVSIVVEGDGMMTLDFPELPGDWVNWKLEAWDLTDALDIFMVKDDVPIGDPIPIAREMAQPELVGGHPFDYQENPDQPLYTSGLPLIQVPVRRGSNKHQALAGWSVHIVSPFDAIPNVNEHISLQNQSDVVDLEDDKARFPLIVVLGEKPAGIYDIRVSGSRGLGCEHRVRLWPKLLVKDLSFNFPDPKLAHQDYQFELHLQEGAYLENQAGAERVEIIDVDGSYLINAPSEVYRVRLDLVAESDKSHKVRVPVSVPLPRLRWALAEEKTPGSLTFGHEPLHISTSRFEQYQSSALYFEMHSLEEKLHKLKCQLVEVGNGDQLRMEGKLSPVGFIQDRLRVPLRPFSTTIQEVDDLMQFELVYQHSWNSEPIRYPVLTLSPQLAIQAVSVTQVDETSWRLTWEAEKPLKNRRVMIKSLWQPWQTPIEREIPNEAKGEFILKGISLPASHYEVYFYVMNTWSERLTEPPDGIQAHVVQLCLAEERLYELGKPKVGHDEQFKAAIEKACVYDSLGDSEQRDQAVSKAAKHLRHLKDVRTLVGSIRWMQNKDIRPSFKSFFLKNLFNDQIVKTMLEKYRLNDPDLIEYLHMVSQVESIYLDSAKILLAQVDDPVVMSACLKTLVRRNDQGLVDIMVAMMEAERLSVDDALTYLLMMDDDIVRILAQFEDPDWSPFEWSHYREPLISKYLGVVFDEIPDKSLPIIKQAMLRAAWFETSQDRMHAYLKDLIENDWDGAYLVLIDRHLAGILDERYFISLLTLCPEKSIEMLTDESNWWGGHHPTIVDYLEEEYPHVVKALHPGLVLKTPFGIARIEKIIGPDGKSLEKAKLTDEYIRVEMVAGEGLEEIKVTLDFEEMEIDFWGKESVWRCECCQAFVHPDQNKILSHHREAHPTQNCMFGKVKNPRFFTRNDIQYLRD